MNPSSYQKDMDEVQKRLGKQSEIPSEEKGKTMTVDFEYVAPSEPYFHFVRTMLVTYLDGEEQENFDMSAMADYLLERASIGSVIASSLGDEDPEKNPMYANLPDEEFEKIAQRFNAQREVYGFLSIASLSWSHEKLPWLGAVYKYVIAKADKFFEQNPAKSKHLKQIIDTKNVGLLVSERLVNMPPDVVPKLHEQLPEDLAFTKEQDDIEDPKEFEYEYLLVLSKFTVPNELVAKGQHKKEDRLYYHWEDQVFEKHSELVFNFLTTFKEMKEDGSSTFIQGACAQAGGGKETQFRLIYLLKWSEYKRIISTLTAYVQE